MMDSEAHAGRTTYILKEEEEEEEEELTKVYGYRGHILPFLCPFTTSHLI